MRVYLNFRLALFLGIFDYYTSDAEKRKDSKENDSLLGLEIEERTDLERGVGTCIPTH